MLAKLVLEDGRVFEGVGFGSQAESYGEVVFNTALTGYQEIITDPSYKGQIVAMTYPLIGNYGINSQDVESRMPFIHGFIIKELSPVVSNWRAEKSLQDYFNECNIAGIQGVDTRALTRHIRINGSMRAVISTQDLDTHSLLAKVRASAQISGKNLAKEVSVQEPYVWQESGKYHVVAVDCGIKYNILRHLANRLCRVTVVPYNYPAAKISALKPDGLFLSNGPGDPEAVTETIATTRALLGKVPIFGICLGHQILGLALGGKTFKLKFGHHGGNHPVKDVSSGRIAITSQNHNFCVDIKSLNKKEIAITHSNLNDATVEGMRHKNIPAFSVQFHPENAPGPHDAEYLFDQFIAMMHTDKKIKPKHTKKKLKNVSPKTVKLSSAHKKK